MEESILMDSESYHGKKEQYSYKDIVMRQLQRVVIATSKEMRGGFVVKHYIGAGHAGEISRYVGDTRKELIRSIDCLHDLLMPKFDKEMQKHSEEIYQEDSEKNVNEEKYDWFDRVKLYRRLFQQLCLFMERKKWFETESIEE